MKFSLIFIVLILSFPIVLAALNISLDDDSIPKIKFNPSLNGTGESFLRLTDTPSTYTGSANECVIVGAGADGLVFGSCSGGGSSTLNIFDQDLNTTNNVQFANLTTIGTLINFSTFDSSLKIYSKDHTNFGSNNGESIELIGTTPTSKPYIGWYGFDPANNNIRGVGWFGCHYNLTNGNIHQHCSWETLDNITGDSTINTKLEISYGSNLTTSDKNLFAKFSSLERVIIGSGVDLHIADGDLVGDSANLDLFSDDQTTIGLRIRQDGSNVILQALGGGFDFNSENIINVGDLTLNDDLIVDGGNIGILTDLDLLFMSNGDLKLNGNLTIGATNTERQIVVNAPSTFVVQGSTISPAFVTRFRNTALIKSFVAESTNNVATRSPTFTFISQRTSGNALADNDELGKLEWLAHDGTDYNNGAKIIARIDGSVSSNTVPTELVFQTATTNAPTTRLTISPLGLVAFTENSTFEKDVIINGILYGGSPVKIDGINVTNNIFMFEENLNSSSRFILKNINSGSNATAVISAINNVGGSMFIGIGSDKFIIGLKNYFNVTALFSKSRGKMVFANFFDQSFVWLSNPLDDGNSQNLVEIMSLDNTGLNITENLTIGGVLFLSNDYTISGQSKVLKRNSATGAVFGVENRVAGANANSGAGYTLITNTSNYTIDLHSSLDLNNPNQVIHHLRGDLTAEKWRVQNGTFEFERGLDDPIFIVNASSTIITIFNLSGTGNAYVCVDPNGVIFRSGVICVGG